MMVPDSGGRLAGMDRVVPLLSAYPQAVAGVAVLGVLAVVILLDRLSAGRGVGLGSSFRSSPWSGHDPGGWGGDGSSGCGDTGRGGD